MGKYERSERGAHTARLHAQRFNTSERRLAALREESEREERKYNLAGEPEVVIAKQLANIIEVWRDRWLKERNPNDDFTGSHKTRQDSVMGPMDWLKEMTGINIRQLTRITSGETKYVGLAQADLIVTVIQRQELLGTDDLRIIPNPNWSPEKWLAYMEERGCI